jgi:hypothetical protein
MVWLLVVDTCDASRWQGGEQLPTKTDDVIVLATKRALQLAGSLFGDFVDLYLENTHGVGVEMVATDPERFHTIISGLMGEKACRHLESVILEILETESGVKIQGPDFSEAIRTMKRRESAPEQQSS